MGSRYVVFQYLPDPITDERINFGVAAFGEAGFHARFLHDWRRVSSFSGADIRFLRQFAARVEDSTSDRLPLRASSDEDIRLLFEDAPSHWINSIQVTEPRGSTKPADALVDEVARRFLRTQTHRSRRRDRRWIRAHAYDQVIDVLVGKGHANRAGLVRRNEPLQGAVEPHEIDIWIGNGQPLTVALALSFERQNFRDVQRDYAAAAWTIEDIRKREGEALPFAVLMLPPARGTSKTYEQAIHVFEELNTRPVPQEEIDDWASDAAGVAMGAPA